jgi:hypothetical protein
MTIEYQKSQNEIGGMWSICKHHSFSDESKEERNPNIGEMTIMRNTTNRISGGPVLAYFYYESDADEYIKFKNEQLKQI